MTRRKTVAILFAILFLCYYQEWIIILIVDCTSSIGHFIFGTEDNTTTSDTKLLSNHDNNNDVRPKSSSSVSSLLLHRPSLPSSPRLTHTAASQDIKEVKAKAPAKSQPKVMSKSMKEAAKKKNLAQQLSIELQSQLAQLQYFDNAQNEQTVLLNSFCNRPKLQCGPPVDCELGCQIHHFITCLVIAYTSNRTLIPDFKYWPYPTSWSIMFKPIVGHVDTLLLKNSTLPNCPIDENNNNNNFVNINNDISIVNWTKDKVEVCTRDILEYPFLNGILPVPYDIGLKLKKAGIASPFQWWIGQFAKFVMRLQPKSEQNLIKTKSQFLKLQRSNQIPIVGIMIRRRDKLGEKKKTSNSLDKYMTIVKKYFSKYESLSTTPSNFTRRIYFATDDLSLLLLARKQYPKPKWEFLTFPNTKSEVENLIKDIFLLRECDLILCSFSSDICRLVSEVLETKAPGGSSHVKSLDHKYFFDVPDFKGKNKLRIILQ